MDDPYVDHNPRVELEPHLRGIPLRLDESEEKVRQRETESSRRASDFERMDQGVWEEPWMREQIQGTPPGSIEPFTYSRWLEQGRLRYSAGATWLITAGIALAAGPWAIAGALLNGAAGLPQVFLVVLIGPIVEELMKTAIPFGVIETRPFWFRSRTQVVVCSLAGGLVFALIENLLYLNVIIQNPSAQIVAWRWTVCTAMHATSSTIVGVGLARIWGRTWSQNTRPDMTLGYPLLVTGIVVHAVYNASAIAIEAVGWIS